MNKLFILLSMMITLNLNASKTAIESTKSIHHFERKEVVLWVVLGEDWKWFDGTYALNINDEQNLKSFKDKMLEELALRAIEFNESLNWNDSYLTLLSLLYLAGSYRSNNSILWEVNPGVILEYGDE